MEVVMSYLQKKVSGKTKNINVKEFNMMANKDKAKKMAKHISCNCESKFNRTTCNPD